MNDLWARYAAKLNAMSLRERALVFLAGVFVIGFALWLLALQPLVDGGRRLARQLVDHNTILATLTAQIGALQRSHAVDPDIAIRSRIADIERQIRELDVALTERQAGFVAPAQMPQLVKGLLARAPGLRLIALQTLPAAPIAEESAAVVGATLPARPVAAGMYKHGLDLTLEGRFGDLLTYAMQLEKLPVRVLWNRTRIDALAYPKVTMTLTLYTLSLERTWLQL